jgi:hypothetical protein
MEFLITDQFSPWLVKCQHQVWEAPQLQPAGDQHFGGLSTLDFSNFRCEKWRNLGW